MDVLFPHESLAGYFVRRRLIEGRDLRPVLSAFVDRIPALARTFLGWRVVPRSTAGTETVLRRFSSSRARDLACHHTIAPMYQPTLGPDVVRTMGSIFELPGAPASPRRSSVLNAIRNRPTCGRVQFCPSCFKLQVRQFGMAYYRREWSIPYVRNCTIHAEPLLRVGCPHCGGNDKGADLSRNFEQYCQRCSADLWESGGHLPSEAYLRTDTWFGNLLRDPLPFLAPQDREYCFQAAADRLNGRRLDVQSGHRCTNECDRFACTERLGWMLDRRGRVNGQSLIHHLSWNTSYMEVPVFLLFWLPIIHAFGTVAEFRSFLVESGLDSDDGTGALENIRKWV